jgi:phenylacetate-CoA ligase
MFSVYSTACEKLVLPLADAVVHHNTMAFYNFYKETQWWDRQRLKDYQNKHLAETIRIAYNETHFYKELYDTYNIDPKTISSTSDLAQLPVVTKDMLRASYPAKCTRDSGLTWAEHCTSGSSGKPFAIRIDKYSLSRARALMFLRANFSGWNIGDPFIQTGVSPDRGVIKKIKDLIMRVDYISAFNLTDNKLDHCLDLIDKKKLNYIMGYPAGIYCLALRAAHVGFNHQLKGIVTWGDNLYQHYRINMESVFKCRVTDTYGCCEGIQIAAQCGMNNGAYHIFMPHVAVEVVDDKGFPVSPGEVGNILLTRLDAGAMPLIRYKVGDIGRKSLDDACPCGRGLEMLTKIEGRDTDIIITPNGNRLIVHFFTAIFEYYQTIDTFKIIQEKPGAIIVEIMPKPAFRKEDLNKLKAEILVKGDPDLEIEFRLVDEIPPEKSNKRRFVVSKLNSNKLSHF